MKRFLRPLFRSKTSTKPASRRRFTPELRIEQLSERLLLSVTPVGAPIDVTGLDHAAPVEAAGLGERTVARAENGNYVAVWNSYDQAAGGVYYRLFDAASNPLTEARQLRGTDSHDRDATVAMNGYGEFAIAWVTGTDYDRDIYTYRFDTNGDYVGHLNVADSSPMDSFDPAIALNEAGWLTVAYSRNNNPVYTAHGTSDDVDVILWTQSATDRPGNYFYAGQGYAGPNGLRDAFEGRQPSIALNENSQGVLAYSAKAGGIGLIDVFTFTPQAGLTGAGRGLSHTAQPGEYEYTSTEPAVDINQSGTIVVAFNDTFYADPGLRGPVTERKVMVDRWTANFATSFPEQQVLNIEPSRISPYSSLESHPAVALNENGTFAVAARQELYKFSVFAGDDVLTSTAVVGRVFDSAGNPLDGGWFEAESVKDAPVTHTQDGPSLATDGAGNFVVSYVDDNMQGSALKASLFTLNPVDPGGDGGDDGGGMAINHPPQIDALDGPADAFRGRQVTFTASASDPDQDGGLHYNWQVVDENGQVVDSQDADDATAFSFTPSAVGTFTITLTVSDIEGETATSSAGLHVTPPFQVQADPFHPGKQALVVYGTEDNDVMLFKPGRTGQVQAVLNGEILGSFKVSQVMAYGLGGDDTIGLDSRLKLPALLDGGQGNDILTGGALVDVLVGGEGDDLLTGLAGRNILIGGGGADDLRGGASEDLLIADRVSFDGQADALAAIAGEWAAPRTQASRIANLSGDGNGPAFGSRLNGDFFLTTGEGGTVAADESADVVRGGLGKDWFFSDGQIDSLLDRLASERLDATA